MDNTCPTCGNDLKYGVCGNLAIYCTHCEYHISVDGEYVNKDYNDEWVKNWDNLPERMKRNG